MWKPVLEQAVANGLNGITAYTFWNIHEPVPGEFDFGQVKLLLHASH